ncbi:arsenate reductase, glutathione/glutaredoxin type [Pseudanabaenaceae cyanobacterium LEGE 13415]|nr:arsenate reductase, glutathione/glutaredoxin type [Pseudanabaenaceae cyanobacterium LEGE 13415]
MKRVMFVCKKNSRRSQMAEGFAKMMGKAIVTSAGLEASYLDPIVVQVMSEVGVDVSQQTSNALSEFDPENFDVVISLCGCGVDLPKEWISRDRFEDWQLDDPEGESIDIFRRVRDQIKERVITLLNQR